MNGVSSFCLPDLDKLIDAFILWSGRLFALFYISKLFLFFMVMLCYICTDLRMWSIHEVWKWCKWQTSKFTPEEVWKWFTPLDQNGASIVCYTMFYSLVGTIKDLCFVYSCGPIFVIQTIQFLYRTNESQVLEDDYLKSSYILSNLWKCPNLYICFEDFCGAPIYDPNHSIFLY